MPVFQQELHNIVLLGNFNPSIVNHDFLLQNGILPKEAKPFCDLLNDEAKQPFSEFFSNPLIAKLRYEYVSFIVQDTRFEASERSKIRPRDSFLPQIVKMLYDDILKFTPIEVAGVNRMGKIRFETEDKKIACLAEAGVDRKKLFALLQTKEGLLGTIIGFFDRLGKVEVVLKDDPSDPTQCELNFNLEWKGSNSHEILSRLTEMTAIEGLFNSFLSKFGVAP